ncbi:tRNA lysidine(34) synthetase TilS [Mucilaginibacter terrenus]|uniref:tRNA(Ile)-lysidine synthase n=1 Tax=Mucilaginibacter terrenus TaxID=2482727 RepID=A0A3E2NLC7_9SPHI|nr:tRNA lysidine(34) synthetase TilS [Mucilaginibacter terrenus]RFZ81782.1 tRNA lysidine(34) synthetase TilS [Mucilaginibacter terrenus]
MLPVERFTGFINQHNLFRRDTKILAAVSGGMDSVLMAHLLSLSGYNFGIAHCNFMLRGSEADADQEFTRQLSQRLNKPFYTINFDTAAYASEHKISIQMAARDLRYNWFDQLLKTEGFDTVALAHHQNDTIETILLNLTRGTGIAGLHGILPKNGSLVRPLLGFTRDEIEQIVTAEQIEYREDSSNASTKYARNKIRHEVVPALKALNPNLEATFENTLRGFRELEQLLDETVERHRNQLVTVADDEIRIEIDQIDKLSPKRLLLFKLLQPYGFTEPVVDDLLTALGKHPGRVFESGTHQLVVDRKEIIISELSQLPFEEITIEAHQHTAHFGNYKLTILHDDSPLIVKDNPLAVSIDADKLSYPLTVRSWKQGDQFYPLGMRTRKKLSDFFVSEKVPLHKKKDVPVLVNANGNIIWLGGYRLDNRYKVDDTTKKVTIFELTKI